MKKCKADNCRNFVFSNLYCLMHQYLRTDAKYLERKQKEREIKIKIKKYPLTVKESTPTPIVYSFGYRNQTDMFFDLWEKARVPGKGVICPFTHESLDHYFRGQFFWNCFAHVLPKGRYTYWKLNPENIRIVHPNFHAAVDAGSTDDRKRHPGWDFDAWDALVERKKDEYRQFKKDNLLA